MKVSTFTFPSIFADNLEIHVRKWETQEPSQPKAVVQLIHGMAEHVERYDEFARFLVENGYIVYGNDHRGHGKTIVNKEDYGFFADEDGFEKAVADLNELTKIIENENPHVPIILMGHSMGSFLVRRYIQLYGNNLHGAIISGTGGDPGIAGKLAKLLARREIRKKGKRTPSPFLSKLVFGNNNKAFQPGRTEYDWLSSAEETVDNYINDPLCGGTCTAGFFLDLFEGLELIHDKKNIALIPKSLPLYIFSGEEDPVGGKRGKGVLEVYHAYKNAAIKDVTYKLYKDGRHEMLNETNKQQVFKDILGWINERL